MAFDRRRVGRSRTPRPDHGHSHPGGARFHPNVRPRVLDRQRLEPRPSVGLRGGPVRVRDAGDLRARPPVWSPDQHWHRDLPLRALASVAADPAHIRRRTARRGAVRRVRTVGDLRPRPGHAGLGRARNPKMLWTTGSTETRMTGPRTKIPHSPYTTDGTAASSSTTYVSGIRSHGGESSERKIAMPRLIGTPTRRASAEVTSVPYTNGTAPKTKGGTGFQTLPVKNPRPKVRMESCAARVRMTVSTTRRPTTPNPTAVESH